VRCSRAASLLDDEVLSARKGSGDRGSRLPALDTRITIRLEDGQVLEKVESAAIGHPRKPMRREQLEAKFFECAQLAISVELARRAADMIWNLEKPERVGTFIDFYRDNSLGCDGAQGLS
jgi:2-methylcitrate dehydratase PrpD